MENFNNPTDLRTVLLEYNTKEQRWNFNIGADTPDTDGWFTVMNPCTREQYYEIDEYALLKNPDRYLWTEEFLLECVEELKSISSLVFDTLLQ